jgi:hypothetical protein
LPYNQPPDDQLNPLSRKKDINVREPANEEPPYKRIENSLTPKAKPTIS